MTELRLQVSPRGWLMVTARLIRGPADGWSRPVPEGTANTLLTMIDGTPRLPPALTDPAADRFLRRARGHWETYAPLAGLPLDERGRVGPWAIRALPDQMGPAALISEAPRADVERHPQYTGNPDLWAVPRQSLATTGYVLRLPVQG